MSLYSRTRAAGGAHPLTQATADLLWAAPPPHACPPPRLLGTWPGLPWPKGSESDKSDPALSLSTQPQLSSCKAAGRAWDLVTTHPSANGLVSSNTLLLEPQKGR